MNYFYDKVAAFDVELCLGSILVVIFPFELRKGFKLKHTLPVETLRTRQNDSV